MPERWRLLAHLMRKDWRRFWLWALLCWAGVLVRWVLPDLASNRGPLSGALKLVTWVLPVIAQARLIHADPVAGDTAFWLTRPIPRMMQLSAKLLLNLAAVMVPCVALEVAPLALTGLALGARDYASAVLGVSLRYSWLLAAALPAALTRSLGGLVLFYAAVVFPGVIVLEQSYSWWPQPVAFTATDRGLSASRSIVHVVASLASALVGLVLVYRTRHLRRASITAMALLVVAYFVGRAWPVNLLAFHDPLPSVDLRQAEPGAAAWSGVSLQIADGGRRWGNVNQTAGVSVARVGVFAAIKGLPPGLSLVELSYSATATTASGRVVRSEADLRQSLELPMAGAHELPGIASVAAGCPPDERIEVFRTNSWESPKLREISGTIRFAVVRPFVLRRGPVRPGQGFEMPRRRVTIERVVDEESAVDNGDAATPVLGRIRLQELILADAGLVVPVLGDSRPDGVPWVVVDASGECRAYRSLTSGGGPQRALVYRSREHTAQFGPVSWPPSERTPAGWLAGSELVFFSAELLGTIELPFDTRRLEALVTAPAP